MPLANHFCSFRLSWHEGKVRKQPSVFDPLGTALLMGNLYWVRTLYRVRVLYVAEEVKPHGMT